MCQFLSMVSFRKPRSDVGCRDHKKHLPLFILQNQIPPHCFEIKFSIHSSEDSLRQFIKPILSLATRSTTRSPDRSTRLSEFFSRSSEIVSRGPPPPAYGRIVSLRPHRIHHHHHHYHQCDHPHHYQRIANSLRSKGGTWAKPFRKHFNKLGSAILSQNRRHTPWSTSNNITEKLSSANLSQIIIIGVIAAIFK